MVVLGNPTDSLAKINPGDRTAGKAAAVPLLKTWSRYALAKYTNASTCAHSDILFSYFLLLSTQEIKLVNALFNNKYQYIKTYVPK